MNARNQHLYSHPSRPIARVALGVGALLLLAAMLAGFLAYNFLATPKTPPPAALQAALADKLALRQRNGRYTAPIIDPGPPLHGNRYTIASFNPGQPLTAPDNTLRYNATLTARLDDTLYAPVATVDYIQNEMNLDTSAERKIEQILAAPGGARIRELAGLDATADTLADTQLVRETAHAGTRYEFRATLIARRDATVAGGWRIDITALTPQTPLPDGEPLAHFNGRRLLDITRESDLAALRRLLAQSSDALRRVEQARDRYRAELAADTARATDAYLALLVPRTLFTGKATTADTGRVRSPSAPKSASKKTAGKRGGLGETALPAPLAISIEIETLDRAAARITALLRTDNSWNDARHLKGDYAYDIASNALVLNLSAPAGPALTGTNGTALVNANAFKITLRLSPDADYASSRGLTLTGGPPRGWTTRLSRVPDADRDATIAALNATAGKLLEATRPGTVYRVSLASPASAAAGNAGFPLGTTARSAAQTAKKNLGAPGYMPPATDSQLPAEMLLRITAQNPRTHTLTATLEDTASDWTRELQGTTTDNIFRAAGYPIRFSADNITPPIALALRFSATDAHALEGTLQSSASAPASAALAITLTPADEQYLAQVAEQKAETLRKTEEQARLDRLVTHPDLATLPPADGAYLWRSGLWLPLPRNGARIARSTMQKIGGIWNAARSLVTTRSDKQDIGTLTFEGTAPPPVAPADATANQPIILAYRGPMKIYAGVPANRIPIEIALLEIKGTGNKRMGTRTVELERLGDSAATFGANAIAAHVEQPDATSAATTATNIYLVRITHALPPGRYVLAAPDQPFEFEVR